MLPSNVNPKKENTDAPAHVNGCYNCGEVGHFANRCPKKGNNVRVNHMSMEEAEAATDVVLGTFTVLSKPATVFLIRALRIP